jgi:hypothetical protein
MAVLGRPARAGGPTVAGPAVAGPAVAGADVAGRASRHTTPVPALPDTLRVEVAAVGELRCAMCLARCRPPVNRLTGAMSLATFRGLLDDLPGLRELTLQGMGEPLLAPNLVDMIRYAKSRGVRVAVDSNGTLLYRDRAEELVEAGLDRLRVSLDGADPQGFDGGPEGAHFGPVLENLAGLVAARRAAERDTPGVRVVFVATPQNVAQLPDMVALLGGIGVAEVRVQYLSPLVDELDPDGVLYREPLMDGLCAVPVEPPAAPARLDPELAVKAFAEARLAAEEYALDLRLPESGAPDTARGAIHEIAHETAHETGRGTARDSAYVTCDGVVRRCCGGEPEMDGPPLGRLGDRTFADLWAGLADHPA